MTKPRLFLPMLAIAAMLLAPVAAHAASAEDINRDSTQALHDLYKTNSLAERLSHTAKAILVFPNIVKGGFILGGSYGEGELLEGGRVTGYYNSASATVGLQAGAQSYKYVMFLMNDKALKYLHDSHGWEIGAGPTVAIVDEGVAKNLSNATMKDDAYAFIFGQQGLMAGINLEGSKITKIKK